MNTTIQFEIGTGVRDTTVFHVELDDGAIGASATGPAEAPDITMIMPPGVFAAVVARELPVDEGYMQGRIKVRGNVGRMLSVMPVLMSEPWTAALAKAAPA